MVRKFDPPTTTFFKADILRSMAAQSGGSMLDQMHRQKLRALKRLTDKQADLVVTAKAECFKTVSLSPLEEYPAGEAIRLTRRVYCYSFTRRCLRTYATRTLPIHYAAVVTFENTQSRARVLRDYHFSW
jgi:hypothetical protein